MGVCAQSSPCAPSALLQRLGEGLRVSRNRKGAQQSGSYHASVILSQGCGPQTGVLKLSASFPALLLRQDLSWEATSCLCHGDFQSLVLFGSTSIEWHTGLGFCFGCDSSGRISQERTLTGTALNVGTMVQQLPGGGRESPQGTIRSARSRDQGLRVQGRAED